MSQQQPRRPQEHQQQQRQPDPIKYGDVFGVSGDLADKPIAPQDAAMMRTAEASVIGDLPGATPGAAMQAAAALNVRAGAVRSDDVTDVARDRGVAVAATEYPGTRVVTESVGGQVLGQVYEPTGQEDWGQEDRGTPAGVAVVHTHITIGEALEAAIATAGDKPVDQSDAAAILAAEIRATGFMTPGGVGAAAQSAATFNAGMDRDEDKIRLADVLTGATARLPGDKVATRDDADGVGTAEMRNNPNLTTNPGGVAASVAAAARLNEGGGGGGGSGGAA